jgi:ParB family chromosome partitioning protein
LIKIAETVRNEAEESVVVDDSLAQSEPNDASIRAFEAVFKAAAMPDSPATKVKKAPARKPKLSVVLPVEGRTAAKLVRSDKGVSLDLGKGPFADWIESHGQDLIEELHARWIQHRDD